MTTLPANTKLKAQEHNSFFRPYKPGQGFWTRLGTGGGAALIILFTVHFLYERLPAWVRTTTTQTVSQAQYEAMRDGAQSTTRVLAYETVGDGVRVTLERIWLSPRDVWLYVVLGSVALVLGSIAWWLINRPKSAEFLINTDVEMKKVNWTGRRELIGSTKVVVLFMILLALTLFFYDIIFGYFFYLINVLKIAPFTA